jgi:hypothetical protein
MKTMTHRKTFSLDAKTTSRIKYLSNAWHVSQAEVIRRAVADAQENQSVQKPDPVEMLKTLQEKDQCLAADKAETWLNQVREDRKSWRTS